MGQIPHRSVISAISIDSVCEVTTEEDHGLTSFDFVRLTNMNGAMPVPHGADQLNNNKYRIIKTGETTFIIQNPITFEVIDSTFFTPYTEGGSCNKIEQNFIYYNDEE